MRNSRVLPTIIGGRWVLTWRDWNSRSVKNRSPISSIERVYRAFQKQIWNKIDNFWHDRIYSSEKIFTFDKNQNPYLCCQKSKIRIQYLTIKNIRVMKKIFTLAAAFKASAVSFMGDADRLRESGVGKKCDIRGGPFI